MKQPNEKKQDLLLDALSYIDDDILARSLALRDGKVTPAKGMNAAEATKGATVTPPLYDLTRRPDKPPKRNGGRIAAVIVAACLLLCVVPLSMWMVGSMSKNESGDIFDEPTESHAGIQNGNEDIGDIPPEDSPGVSPDLPIDSTPSEGTAGAPEAEDPGDTSGGTDEPVEEPTESATRAPIEEGTEGVTEAETYFDPHELVWNPTNGDSIADYTAQAHNGANANLIATFNSPVGSPVSAEDEMALQMVAQWLLSVYALDYGDHFPLFYESFVQEVFIKEAVSYDRTYPNAIQYMDGIAAELLPIEEVYLILHLEENTLLAGDELETYRATKPAFETARGFYPELITAVRRIRVLGGIEIDGFYPFDSVGEILGEAFYIYEYEGKWYLDETFMDDDLSIDLLGTGTSDRGFYKMRTTAGTVVAVDDIYLYLDTGHAFRIDGARVQIQTDNGEWQDVEINVGDIVSVSHYSFELEGLTRTVDGTENDEWRLATADRVKIIG